MLKPRFDADGLAILTADEKKVAAALKSKGYHYAIQFVKENGAEFGEPLYFKGPDSAARFMRENNLKQKWIIHLGACPC